jgi:hypothetical protein
MARYKWTVEFEADDDQDADEQIERAQLRADGVI